MFSLGRLAFGLILFFWVSMNVLLWRSEYGGARDLGSAIPSTLVWEKILTAPDDSTLEIFRQGKKIGHCRWQPKIAGEENESIAPPAEVGDNPSALEGMVKTVEGFVLSIEGNASFSELGARVRFEARAGLSSDHEWKEMLLRIMMRPIFWELKGDAEKKLFQYTFNDGVNEKKQTFAWADLRNAAKLLGSLGGELLPIPLPALEAFEPSADSQALTLGLEWKAWNDWLKIGGEKVRVYRLEARLLEKHSIVIHVSRVGELLRVQLPYDIHLVNDALVQW